MIRTLTTAAALAVCCALTACGDREQGSAVPGGAPIQAPRSRATVVLYEWPPYVDDVDPETPGAQPFFDLKAPNPYGGADPGLRQIRVHVTPGRNADGSVIRVMGVHVQGPPGAELAAHEAYVSQSHVGWTATRSADGTGYSFHASGEPIPMPETGLVFLFVCTPGRLEKAHWRDVRLLLTSDASDAPPTASPGSIVGTAYRIGDPPNGPAVMLPYDPGD